MAKYNLKCDTCGATCIGVGFESGPGPGVELREWPVPDNSWEGGNASCTHLSFTIVGEVQEYDDDDFYQR